MHGLYLVWWVQEKQVPAATVAAILAAGNLAVMAFELPTGWLADRFGHRVSLLAGSALQVVAMLWCWLGDGVAGLTIACVLVGIADAFRSGADQALVYRSSVAVGDEAAFQRLEARSHAAALCALVALTLAGGVIVHLWGFAAGWVAETALSAVGLALAWAMREPPSQHDAEHDGTVERRHVSLVSVPMAVLVLPAACLGGMSSATGFLAQTMDPGSATRITLLVALMTLAEAAGSAFAARLRPGGAGRQAALALAGIASTVVALLAPALLAPAALALAFLDGVGQPMRAAAIQRLASDAARARAASLASACDMAVDTIGLLAAGIIGRRRV